MRAAWSLNPQRPPAKRCAAAPRPPRTVPSRQAAPRGFGYGFGNQAMQKSLGLTFQTPAPAAGAAPAAAVGPRQKGTIEFEGEPRAQSLEQPSLNPAGDSVSTHAGRPQIDWVARVTQKGSTADCLEVGFLQTVVKNDVEASYTPAAWCRYELKPLPVRDGEGATPVWMQISSAHGRGYAPLGTCQLEQPGSVPPGISPVVTSTTVNVSNTDDPGGRYPIQHPADGQRTLSSIHEVLGFDTWLAVRPRQADAGTLASYTFLRHMQWSVHREMTVKPHATGVGATVNTSETKIDLLEDGKGKSNPELGSTVANDAVNRNCTLPATQPKLLEQIP